LRDRLTSSDQAQSLHTLLFCLTAAKGSLAAQYFQKVAKVDQLSAGQRGKQTSSERAFAFGAPLAPLQYNLPRRAGASVLGAVDRRTDRRSDSQDRFHEVTSHLKVTCRLVSIQDVYHTVGGTLELAMPFQDA